MTPALRILSSFLLALPAVALAEAPALLHAGSAYADAKGGRFRSPEGVACTDDGRVVAADTANGRLVTLSYKDGALVGGQELKFPELGVPVRVEIDSKGNVLALDQRTRRLIRVSPNGEFGGVLEPANVPATPSGTFWASFKLDAQDNLYLLDLASQRVVLLDAKGAFVRQIPLPKGGFVTDLAIDSRAIVYALDPVAGVLWSAPRTANAFTALTKALKDYASFPTHLAIAEGGRRLVLVDKNGNGLVLLGPDGSFHGRQLAIGWEDGLVYYPAQICVTAHGETFVADRNNHRIQVFTTPPR